MGVLSSRSGLVRLRVLGSSWSRGCLNGSSRGRGNLGGGVVGSSDLGLDWGRGLEVSFLILSVVGSRSSLNRGRSSVVSSSSSGSRALDRGRWSGNSWGSVLSSSSSWGSLYGSGGRSRLRSGISFLRGRDGSRDLNRGSGGGLRSRFRSSGSSISLRSSNGGRNLNWSWSRNWKRSGRSSIRSRSLRNRSSWCRKRESRSWGSSISSGGDSGSRGGEGQRLGGSSKVNRGSSISTDGRRRRRSGVSTNGRRRRSGISSNWERRSSIAGARARRDGWCARGSAGSAASSG